MPPESISQSIGKDHGNDGPNKISSQNPILELLVFHKQPTRKDVDFVTSACLLTRATHDFHDCPKQNLDI